MADLSQSILVGVIGGVIASVIVGFALTIFKGILIPWIEDRLYTGIDLEGSWEGLTLSQGGIPLHNNFTIEQKGSAISGDYVVNFVQEEKNQALSFDLRGFVKAGYLQLYFSSKSTRRVHLGAMILKISDGGNKLEGGYMYVRRNRDIGIIEEVEFKRNVEY